MARTGMSRLFGWLGASTPPPAEQVRWRVVLEGTPDHTGLMPIGDIKSRIIWHNKKRFQLLAGSGNAILIKHPHGIPRLLERAQGGLGLL